MYTVCVRAFVYVPRRSVHSFTGRATSTVLYPEIMSTTVKLSQKLQAVGVLWLSTAVFWHFQYVYVRSASEQRRPIQFLTIPQRLAVVKTKSAGRLYGIANNGTLLLGFSLADSIENNLPFYVKDVGRIRWTDGSASDTDDNVCAIRETISAHSRV